MDRFLKKWRRLPDQSRDSTPNVQPPTTHIGEVPDVQPPTIHIDEVPDVQPPTIHIGEVPDVQPPTIHISEVPEVQIDEENHVSKRSRVETRAYDATNLMADPGLRRPIMEYHPSDRDVIRRGYLLKGPCQPIQDLCPLTLIGKKMRSFCSSWYTDFGGWIKYSVEKDAVFCIYCYLFGSDKGGQGGGGTYSQRGFRNWERKDKLQEHVGGVNSAHNKAYKRALDLLNQDRHIVKLFNKQTDQARANYRVCLTAVIDCVRFLLKQGLAFRGNDESENSHNRGNFLELLQYTCDHNEVIKVTHDTAPKNLKLTSPDIQKDIVNAAPVETTNAILKDCGDALFSILIDEARDVSVKEQMALVLRYVNKRGCVIEAFLGVVHVKETNAKILKHAIEEVFALHGLNIKSLRGQGYDGASNMQGDLSGLKTLILKDNASAFYVHCFAHQLQLALVAASSKKEEIAAFFNNLHKILNIVGASCKRRDKLQEKRAAEIIEAFENGEVSSGRGLNQETSLKRHGDTRWGSHYDSLLNMILMFSAVLDVVDDIARDGSNADQRGEAFNLLRSIQSFEFILSMHLMKNLLAISNELSKALQRQDQDIVNAMSLVELCKTRIQLMRDEGWDTLMDKVSSRCLKLNVVVPKMEDEYAPQGRPRRGNKVTNLYYYRDKLFHDCIDWQLQELNDRFNEANTELLLCVARLSPHNSFAAFDKEKLVRLAQFYPADFSTMDLIILPDQLDTYVMLMKMDNGISEVNTIRELAKRMVETKKHLVFPLVYLLITLALTLPVATATVEKAFSAMSILKSRLQNRMSNDLLNDCLVTYIEKDIFTKVDNEAIMQRFQHMKPRRGQL